jgi:mersacidin/lichenicidin family type 2 lantibiotic
MSNDKIIRAWKDSKFRASLTAEQRQMLPQNPAGELELNDAELESVDGGLGTIGVVCLPHTTLCTRPINCVPLTVYPGCPN